jgi:hypothetical protein
VPGGLLAEAGALTASATTGGALPTELPAEAPLKLLLPPQAASIAAATISARYCFMVFSFSLDPAVCHA